MFVIQEQHKDLGVHILLPLLIATQNSQPGVSSFVDLNFSFIFYRLVTK